MAACGDPCCGTMPWPGANDQCEDGGTMQCVCDNDAFCCGTGWNEFCADAYKGFNGFCGPASPCGF